MRTYAGYNRSFDKEHATCGHLIVFAFHRKPRKRGIITFTSQIRPVFREVSHLEWGQEAIKTDLSLRSRASHVTVRRFHARLRPDGGEQRRLPSNLRKQPQRSAPRTLLTPEAGWPAWRRAQDPCESRNFVFFCSIFFSGVYPAIRNIGQCNNLPFGG